MTQDPRVDPTLPDQDRDIRPVVARTTRGPSTLLIASGAVGAGLALFLVLDGRRQAMDIPTVSASSAERRGAPAPPPLQLPPAPVVATPSDEPAPIVLPPPPPPQPQPAPSPPQIVYVPQGPAPAAIAPVQMSSPMRDAATLVIDTTAADGDPAIQPGASDEGGRAPASSTAFPATTAAPGARARAIMLAGHGTTVLQGTLIPAVLESALDTARPGLARALVSRDVRGFDGSRVLIPRGSRLTGEYRSDVAAGQNRALVVWTRLVRPDGAAIALASPVADTLGRTGMKAKVDSHFFARFAGAILQSVLAVGVNLASRSNNSDTLVLGLPGSSIGASGFGQNAQVTPTLKVRPGTSISVFVSRDLDFSAVEGRK